MWMLMGIACMYIHLSFGRGLVRYLHIKSCTSFVLVFAQMYLLPFRLNVYSFSNNIFFWTEMKIWRYVNKYCAFVTMLTAFMVLFLEAGLSSLRYAPKLWMNVCYLGRYVEHLFIYLYTCICFIAAT